MLKIEPIAGADAIELARINGWQCVVKKNEFAPNDLGVFFEIDAIPPDTPAFQFLWTPKNTPPDEPIARPAKFRLRTMKLRGALSQGLLLPLKALELSDAEEGDDVTGRLGVTKYEPPLSMTMGGLARGPFPSWLPKTDEMRVQSVPEVLDELRGLPYVCTLKCDGTSATFSPNPRDGDLHVCSRNLSLADGDNIYWNLARQLNLVSLLEKSGLSVQGEICGPGIQKNRLGLKAPALFVFNFYDVKNARFLNDAGMRDFCASHDLTPVEVIERGEAFAHSQESLLALAEGFYPNTRGEREGLVVRPQEERFSPTLNGRLSFKAISNRFLLKEGE